MEHPGFVLVVALNVALLGGTSALVGYWWLRQSGRGANESPERPEEWRDEAVALAGEVQQAVETTDGVANRAGFRRTVVPLAGRIRSHARRAPDGVEPALVRRVFDLGVACYAIGMEHTTREAVRTGEFIPEKLDALRDRAAAVERAAAPPARTTDAPGG